MPVKIVRPPKTVHASSGGGYQQRRRDLHINSGQEDYYEGPSGLRKRGFSVPALYSFGFTPFDPIVQIPAKRDCISSWDHPDNPGNRIALTNAS
jgi:hypothetical protein